ncbi:MAG: hypothetical protein E7136_02825 [Rikenellaceae bacterium]|nr:hypothetical protein [Rikenellaceae bacterium]
MRRLCYISLLATLLLLLSAFVDEPMAYASASNEPREERLETGYERELLCAKEYNNDLWRSPRTITTLTNSTQQSVQQRHRTHLSIRITPHIPSERRAGHLTQIFEYNHYRSSLRVGYYLYALCRLRI